MDAKEILLADLEHVRRLLLTSEAGGEVRVNFLLSFATAVGAGLVALHTSDNPPYWIQGVTFGALIFLILMSSIIYLRILRRNRLTDHYVNMTKDIFEKLRQVSPEIDKIGYGPKGPEWEPKENVALKFFRGGYAQMVAFVIGFLVFALAAVSLCLPVGISIFVGAAVLVVLWIIPQLLRKKYESSQVYAR